MKIKKILTLLFLVAIIAIQGQLVTFADTPPGVDSPFGDTDDDTSPPSLEGGDTDDDTSPPSLEGGDADDADEATDVDDADDADEADETDILGDDADTATVAGVQDDASDSENIISESGPGVAFLLIPSLILGYVYRRKKQ